jgi:2,3-bisphosphoglycerate-dependent phosphoglycerate mutase
MVKKRVFKIYLFRHGQTRFNQRGMFTGWKDSKLTRTGKMEAEIIAERLKNKKFDVAFVTRLSRTRDTLKIVLKYHPECKRIIEDNRMIERNYGKFNGFLHMTIVKKFSPRRYDEWHRGWNARPPGGESFADVEKRVRKFIKSLIKFVKKNKVNVVIASHGNSIRLFRKIMEKRSKEQAVKWFIPYDTYFEYDVRV